MQPPMNAVVGGRFRNFVGAGQNFDCMAFVFETLHSIAAVQLIAADIVRGI